MSGDIGIVMRGNADSLVAAMQKGGQSAEQFGKITSESFRASGAVIDSAQAKTLSFIATLEKRIAVEGRGVTAALQYDSALIGATKSQREHIDSLLKASQAQEDLNRNSSSFGAIGAQLGVAITTGFAVGKVLEFRGAIQDSQIDIDKLRNTLSYGMGSGFVAQEIDYLRKASNDMGLEFKSTSELYAKFAAAARGTALEGKGVKDVFESIGKASTVMGLSATDVQGVMLALTQIMSKGTVQSEEIRGQLGERLPGAFAISARAMGVTTAEFGKMLEAGEVISNDFLPKFAAQMEKEFAGSFENASHSAQASMNRLSNSWDAFKTSFADDAGLGKVVSRLNDGMSSTFNTWTLGVRGMSSSTSFKDFFYSSFHSVETLDVELSVARESMAKLDKELSATPNNIYTRSAAAETRAYIKELETAKRRLDDLRGVSSDGGKPPETPVMVSMYRDYLADGERVAKITKDMAAVQLGLSGVDVNFQKHLAALKAGFQAGLINQGQYVTDVKALVEKEGGIKKDAASKALSTYTILGDAIDLKMAQTREEIALNGTQTKSDEYRVKTIEKITDAYLNGKISAQEWVNLSAKALDATDLILFDEQLKKSTKSILDSSEAHKKMIEATFKSAESIADQTARQEAANAVFGKGKAAIEAMTLAELNHQMAEAQGSDRFSEQYVAGLQSKIDAQKRYVESLNAADYKAISAHSSELLRSAKELDDLYRSEASYATVTGVEREKIIALREVEIKYAKELAKIEASNMSDDEKAAQRQVVNQAKQIEGSAAVSKVMQSDWAKTVEKYDDIFRTGFVEMTTGGKDVWDSFTSSLATTFKTSVADQLYKMFAQPFVMQVVASVIGITGSAVASAAQSGSMTGLMGDAGAASSLFSEGGSLAGIGAMAGEFGAGLANGFASTMAGASVSGTVGVAANVGGAAGAGLGIGAAMPYIAAAAIAYSLLTQDHGTPTATTGDANVSFSGAGDVTGRKTAGDYFWGGSMTKAADDFVVGLNKTYLDTAKNLGIAAVDTYFSYSGNTGKDGAAPNFAIRSSAGNQTYSSGETALSDAAVGLAASRAVFNALQKSDLPKYLAGAFDGMAASSMTQEQIAASLAGATALKQFHDQLQALPFAALKDLSFQATQNLAGFAGGLDKLGANLGTYYDKFYTSEEKIAQLTKNTSADFESLGLVMPALDASTRASYRALIDELEAKDLSVAANARAYSGALALASAVDQLAPALLDTAKASADAAKIASDAAAAASKAAADALSTLLQGWSDSARSSVAESLSAITDSVAAQKTVITDAYSFQADTINASLSTVGTSISKLQSLSSSLKSTLDSMRISGSDSAYRADAQAQIRAALATARSGGGLPLDGMLTSALATISKPSDQLYGNFVDYARDFYSTANDIAALGDLTGQQLTADEVTQKLLTTQNATLKSGFDAEVKRLDALVSEAKVQADAVMKSAGATLSMADALARFTSTLGATLTNSMATAFEKIDANQSSGIDWAEFKQSFGGLASEATLKTLFKAADYNGDGHISQLEAIKANTANLLAVMSVSGAGGALSGAKTFTGTEVAGAIKALADSGATTAQIINAANANFGVTSASLAQVATVTGNTGITDYQKRIDATTPIPASEMSSLMQAVNADAAARGVSAEESLYIWAKANGYNAGMVDKKMGWGNGAANAWATSHGYPAFAGGGDHVGGWRMVGEDGPELEATGPSRIFNATQTRSMLQSGGANSSEVVAELRLMADRLEARMAKIEANTRATAGHTAGTDRKLTRVIPGNAVIIQAATA